jgi:hypothetical protein
MAERIPMFRPRPAGKDYDFDGYGLIADFGVYAEEPGGHPLHG